MVTSTSSRPRLVALRSPARRRAEISYVPCAPSPTHCARTASMCVSPASRLSGASIFTGFMAISGLPQKIAELIVDANLSVGMVLLIVCLLYVFLGCFLDSISMMLLTLPVLLPVLHTLHINLIWFGIVVVKRWRPRVQQVDVAHECLNALVVITIKQIPPDASVVTPLVPLRDFTTHKEQLLAGVSPHETEVCPKVGELLPCVARHLPDQRSFAVDNFVVGQWKNKILRKRVQQAEGNLVVVPATVDRISLDIPQGVVHPPHIPFERESEATFRHGPGNAGPSGGFLRDRHCAWTPLGHNCIEVS